MAASELHALLRERSARGAPVPEVGFELIGSRGPVLAEAELGWPLEKVAVPLPDQEPHVAAFENAGWQVFTSSADDLSGAFANALTEKN